MRAVRSSTACLLAWSTLSLLISRSQIRCASIGSRQPFAVVDMRVDLHVLTNILCAGKYTRAQLTVLPQKWRQFRHGDQGD